MEDQVCGPAHWDTPTLRIHPQPRVGGGIHHLRVQQLRSSGVDTYNTACSYNCECTCIVIVVSICHIYMYVVRTVDLAPEAVVNMQKMGVVLQ